MLVSTPADAFDQPKVDTGANSEYEFRLILNYLLTEPPWVRWRPPEGVLTSVEPGSWIHVAVVGRLRASNSTGSSIPSRRQSPKRTPW
jgi:hypothetical protein